MDYILLVIGLFMIFKRNYSWLFAIIIVLASTYLQLPLKVEMQMMIGPEHNVADTGLLLFLLFWISEVFRNGIYIKNPLQKSVIVFMLFLFFNGVYDLFNGIPLGDIIRYLKNWGYLLLVFVYPNIPRREVVKSIKIIFWITFWMCLMLIVQYILGISLLGFTTTYKANGVLYTRGAKPPSYSIICFCIAFVNLFRFSKSKQVITSIVLFLPVLLCMKMSYFTTICICIAAYYAFNKRFRIIKILQYSIVALLAGIALLATFPVFSQRFNETLDQASEISSDKKSKEGSFSYRIDHFSERLEYVLEDPVRSFRGIGYIQERNFHQKPFKLGQTNNWGQKAMIDTGDIAWSLLILRLGLVGIVFFLYFYLTITKRIYKYSKKDNLCLLFFCYMLVSLVFMSLGNTLIAQSDYYILPILLCMTYENSSSNLVVQYRRSRNNAY